MSENLLPVSTELLLVEDNMADIELTMMALKKNGLSNPIRSIRDGAEALDYLLTAEQRPRVVLLDIKLPKLNGIQILRELRNNERTKTIPVVMLTSSNEDRDVIQTYKLGVNSYIVKPIDTEKFITAIGELGMYWMVLNKCAD